MINLNEFITHTVDQIQVGIDKTNRTFKKFYPVNIYFDVYVDENSNLGGKNKITLELGVNRSMSSFFNRE